MKTDIAKHFKDEPTDDKWIRVRLVEKPDISARHTATQQVELRGVFLTGPGVRTAPCHRPSPYGCRRTGPLQTARRGLPRDPRGG